MNLKALSYEFGEPTDSIFVIQLSTTTDANNTVL
jgi:hypothetical protein